MGINGYGVKKRWPDERPSEGPGSNSLNIPSRVAPPKKDIPTPFEVMSKQPTTGDGLVGYKNQLDPEPEPTPKTPAVDHQTATHAAYEGGMQSMVQDSYVNRMKSEAEDHAQAVNMAMEGGMQNMVQDSYVNQMKSEAEDHAQAVNMAMEGGMQNMVQDSYVNQLKSEAADHTQAVNMAMEGGMGSYINDSTSNLAQYTVDQLIENNAYEPGYEGHYKDTSSIKQLAEDLYYGEPVDDSIPPEYFDAALKNRLHKDEFAQLTKELQVISAYDKAALDNLMGGDTLTSNDGDIGEMGDIEDLAQEIVDNSYHTVPNHGSVIHDSFSDNPFTEVLEPNDIAYAIEQLAKEDPGKALFLKLQIDQKLTPSQRADVDRIIGGGAKTSENVRAAVLDPWEGLKGAGKTYVNTPGELLELGLDVNNLVRYGNADFSNDTFDFMTMEMNGRAQMGGSTVADFASLFGPGALSKSGLSIVREGSEFVIRRGARVFARIDTEGAEALLGRLGRRPPPSNVDAPTTRADQTWWGSDGDIGPTKMNDQTPVDWPEPNSRGIDAKIDSSKDKLAIDPDSRHISDDYPKEPAGREVAPEILTPDAIFAGLPPNTVHSVPDPKILELGVGKTAEELRRTPGYLTGVSDLKSIPPDHFLRGSNKNAGWIPQEIGEPLADKLAGSRRKKLGGIPAYQNFDSLRQDLWKVIAGEPEYAKQFPVYRVLENGNEIDELKLSDLELKTLLGNESNDALKKAGFNPNKSYTREELKNFLKEPGAPSLDPIERMSRGKAPIAPLEQRGIGQKYVYEIHHYTPIKDAGGVYDVNNLVVSTSLKHDYDFHNKNMANRGSGTQ